MIQDHNVRGYHILFPLDLAVTILSLLGSSLTCYFCLRIPSHSKTISVKFIIALSISDFFYSIANVLSNFETEKTLDLCAIEAWVRQSAYVLSIFFSACIAIISYKSSLPESLFNSNKFFMLTTLLGPLVFLLATVFM